MSQVYDDDNNLVPVTIVEAGPCPVLQVKTDEKDGYSAVQIGFNPKGRSPNKVNSCKKGQAAKAGVDPQQLSQEFRTSPEHDLQQGTIITLENFKDIKVVDVVSKTKGKGFQGVVKRHGFAGVGQSTHGQHNRLRAPGSIGAASYPAIVFKGMKMAGQMGNEKVTVQNLKVIKVVPEKNLLVIKGCVPGHKNSIVTIRK